MTMKEIVRQELQRMSDATDEKITPEVVVAAAADPASPLHPFFEWDDAEAARIQRIERARTLIRSVRVKRYTDQTTLDVVYYVRDPRLGPDEAGYVSVPSLQTDEDLKRIALTAEIDRVEALLHRTRNLAEFFGLQEMFEDMVDRLRVARSRLAA